MSPSEQRMWENVVAQVYVGERARTLAVPTMALDAAILEADSLIFALRARTEFGDLHHFVSLEAERGAAQPAEMRLARSDKPE